MRITRPRAMAPWVPSRHRLALFRLIAYVRLARTPAESCTLDDTTVFAIDRDQSTFETATVCLFMWFTVSAFLAAVLSTWMRLPVAVVLAVPTAAMLLNAAMVVIGLTVPPLLYAIGFPRGQSHIAPTSMVMTGAIVLAASYFVTTATWARFPAWLLLGAIGANGVAAIVLLLLRGRVRAAEARCAA